MSVVTAEMIRQKLQSFSALKQRIDGERDKAQGKLPRNQWWRSNYYNFPYLIGAPNERVADRFCDVFMNTSELNSDGKVIPRMGIEDEFPLIEKFTHLIEEWNSRGGVPMDMVAKAREPFLKYFRNGDPVGVSALAQYEAPSTPFLIKYSRKEFLEPMLKNGAIRICPASYYNDANHIDSIRDTETTRTFFIPTFRERLRGETSFEFQGLTIRFGDDDVNIPVEVSDYFMYSLSDELYYRLPTDFDADAALVIREPVAFSQRLISTFLAAYPDWIPFSGKITYYDPYVDYTKISIPEMCKHFGYSYQQEHRIAFRPKKPTKTGLEPKFVSIGAMTAYADLITF